MFSNVLINTIDFSLTAGTTSWRHWSCITTFFNNCLCLQTIGPLCMCQGIHIPAVIPPSYHFNNPKPQHQWQKSLLCLIYIYSVWNLKILINCKYRQVNYWQNDLWPCTITALQRIYTVKQILFGILQITVKMFHASTDTHPHLAIEAESYRGNCH